MTAFHQYVWIEHCWRRFPAETTAARWWWCAANANVTKAIAIRAERCVSKTFHQIVIGSIECAMHWCQVARSIDNWIAIAFVRKASERFRRPNGFLIGWRRFVRTGCYTCIATYDFIVVVVLMLLNVIGFRHWYTIWLWIFGAWRCLCFHVYVLIQFLLVGWCRWHVYSHNILWWYCSWRWRYHCCASDDTQWTKSGPNIGKQTTTEEKKHN